MSTHEEAQMNHLRQAAINGIYFHICSLNPPRLYLDILPRAKQLCTTSEGRFLVDVLSTTAAMYDTLTGTDDDKKSNLLGILAEIECAEGVQRNV